MTSRNPLRPALPRKLKPGDTIGIAAPASPFDKTDFDAGVAVLESMGFRPVIEAGCFARSGYLAGTDRHRAEQLHRLFADPGIHGIVCARGGYGAMRILEYLDAAAIARHPKAFVGFSDITVLLDFLVRRCRMTAFHGPTVTTLARSDAASRDRFFAALTEAAPYVLTAAPATVIVPGAASGRFFCGNLTLICHLTGTPFQPDFSDGLLLIEDQGEAPYRIDRMLTQMCLAGCFDRLAGLALGTFIHCGAADEVYRIVADRLGSLGFPILAGFGVGHGDLNLTLPVGTTARLDTATGSIEMTRPALQ